MKIAISSKGPDITSPIDLGLAEPNYWVIYDTGDHSFEVIDQLKRTDSEAKTPGPPNETLHAVDIIISGKKTLERSMADTHFEIGQFPARSMSVEDVTQMVVKEKSHETDKEPSSNRRRGQKSVFGGDE